MDDDLDGATDYPEDPGCASASATSEVGSPGSAPACDDGIDNDGDGAADDLDGGCDGPDDTTETTPHVACDDGIDNDTSGQIDFPADPGCASAGDPTEGLVVDTDAPVLSPLLLVIEEDRAALAWTTNEPTQGVVQYASSPQDSELVLSLEWHTHHQVILSDLTCGTKYSLFVGTADPLGNVTNSPFGASFTTLACGGGHGAAGHWGFDEGTGVQTLDLSGSGMDGVLVGSSWSEESADGSDFSLSFDGDDDRVDLGSIDLGGGGATISVWAKVRDFTTIERDGRFISKAVGVLDEDHFWMLATVEDGADTRLRTRLRAQGAVEVTVADQGDVPLDEWVHAAAVYDGAEVRLFLDGEEVGRETLTGPLDEDPGVDVAAGNQPVGAGERGLDGLLDDLRVYRRALTPVEIAALYGGQAMTASAVTPVTNGSGTTLRLTTDQAATRDLRGGRDSGLRAGRDDEPDPLDPPRAEDRRARAGPAAPLPRGRHERARCGDRDDRYVHHDHRACRARVHAPGVLPRRGAAGRAGRALAAPPALAPRRRHASRLHRRWTAPPPRSLLASRAHARRHLER